MIHGERWKCHSCESGFSEPEQWWTYGRSRFTHSPDALICPYCKSDDIETAEHCDKCGKVMFNKELTYGLCEDCIERYAEDHAEDYVKSDPDVWDAFAFYMHKRLSREREDA